MTSSVLRVSSYSRRKAKRKFITSLVIAQAQAQTQCTVITPQPAMNDNYYGTNNNILQAVCLVLWCILMFALGMQFADKPPVVVERVVFKDVIKPASFDEKQCLSWMFKSNWKETKKKVCGK